VAGAPVGDWTLYDTCYTERYMGGPFEDSVNSNAEGYKKSSVVPYVKQYDDTNSRLFLYHGMADDNVLFQNSTQVYSELIEHGKVFYSVDYPGSKHSMNGAKVKIHLYKQIFDFLEQQLKNPSNL